MAVDRVYDDGGILPALTRLEALGLVEVGAVFKPTDRGVQVFAQACIQDEIVGEFSRTANGNKTIAEGLCVAVLFTIAERDFWRLEKVAAAPPLPDAALLVVLESFE